MSDLQFAGESFAVADKIGWMPLMKFAVLAKSGVDTDDMEGLVAVYDLLRACIADEDWERFQAHADKVRAGEELLQVVTEAVSLITERPTNQPSDSSDGPLTTSAPSADGYGSPVTSLEERIDYVKRQAGLDRLPSLVERLESQGRPSIALMVEQAEEFRASHASTG